MLSDNNGEVDDTLPVPSDVEREFLAKGTDQAGALAWLADLEIDPVPVVDFHDGHIALVDATINPDHSAGRNRFRIHCPDFIGPRYGQYFACAIRKRGAFIDLLMIDCDDYNVTTACLAATWLGNDEFHSSKTVRLHRDAIDWLEGGCGGVCHIARITKRALEDLRAFPSIECSHLPTALDAWEWGFGGRKEELARFVIDAPPTAIRRYFEELARARAEMILKETDLWPRPAWRNWR
jgi:hypothetical protein